MASEALTPALMQQVLAQTPAGMALLDDGFRAVLVNPAFQRLGGVEGACVLDLAHPEDRAVLAARLRDPSGDPRVRTAVRWGDVESECVVLHVSEPFTVLVALDVTPARKLAYRTQSLSRFASALSLSTSVPDALNALARSVVEATSAFACAVVVLDRPAHPGEGVPSIRTMGIHNLPLEWAETVERLWQSGEPLPPRRALATGRTVVHTGPPEPLRDIAQAVGVDTVASVPMRLKGRIVGLVNCVYRSASDVDEAELAFIETLAPLAAVVAENARLFAQVRETVSNQERQHLARELHDSVSQSLYGIGLGARTALKLLSSADPSRAAEPLGYVLSLAESGLAEMRALLFELRPESLQRDGLVVALQARARSLQGLVVETSLCEEPPMSVEAKHGLFRIASEATHNVVKHAEATRVRLSLASRAEGVTLEIADDGRGFSPSSAPGGMGLASMRERVEALGGRLTVESVVGGGTRVVAVVPGG